MKRGKAEEKLLEPMFPRLHVNDADKGGPRAPPRNKMALYEQLSIPSQRFNDHGSLSLTSRSNTSTLAPPGQSSQPSSLERNLYAQHRDSSSAVHTSEKMSMENVRSLAQHDQRKILREEDDFAVPVYIDSTGFKCLGRTKSGIEKEKHTPLMAPVSFQSFQFQGVNREGSKHLVSDQVKGNTPSLVNTIDLSATEDMNLEKSTSSCDRANDCNASLRQESRNRLDRDNGETRVKDIDNGVESRLPTEAHLKEDHGRPDGVGYDREYSRSRGFDFIEQISEEARDDVSDNSMVDSVTSIDVSPDEVVGVLGQKRFWRARKAIANQQRVFSVQLFELHRLIKVQKLIAASPDLLLDDISYLGKVSAKSYPVKKLLPTELMAKLPLAEVVNKRRSESEKTDQHKMECSAENVVEKLSNQGHHQPSNYMPFVNNPPASPSVNGCCYPPQPQPQPPLSGNQQWLIPVMSPSEGLIYKPHPGMGHTGPVCGGFYGHFMPAPMVMGSFMGCNPPPYHPGTGFPSPGNGYFPPYGSMPTMMNPYHQQQQQQPNEQMNQFGYSGNLQNQNASALNTQQESSANEAPAAQQQPTKSYPRARKSRQGSTGSIPSGPERVSTSMSFRPFSAVDEDSNKNNNHNGPEQMMTTTTTTTRTTVTQTTRDGGVTRVIKVVPHNAKLASENAARIFRSIQEERKHYDSFSNL